MDPKGKVALVTGGSAGIGLAVVRELLQQEVLGVSVCDVNVTKGEIEVKNLQQEFGKNKVIFIKTDVTKEDEVEAAFKQTIKQFGGLDIVFCNAGLCNDKKWQYCISVNLVGVISTVLLGFKYMGRDQGGKGGVIVNTASIAGVGGGTPVLPIYNATKAGVVQLTTNLGHEFHMQNTGVRVMSICPGYTESDILKPMDDNTVVLTPRDDWMPQFRKEVAEQPGIQKVENVSKAVLHMIREGKNGSLWMSEDGEPPYQIKIPDYKQLRC